MICKSRFTCPAHVHSGQQEVYVRLAASRRYRFVFPSNMLNRSSTLSMLVGLRALASLRAADMSSTPPMDAMLMTQMMANDSRSLERTLSMAARQLCASLAVTSLAAANTFCSAVSANYRLARAAAATLETRDRQQQLQRHLPCRYPLSPYSTRDASDSTFSRLRDRSSCVTKPSTRVPMGWPAISASKAVSTWHRDSYRQPAAEVVPLQQLSSDRAAMLSAAAPLSLTRTQALRSKRSLLPSARLIPFLTSTITAFCTEPEATCNNEQAARPFPHTVQGCRHTHEQCKGLGAVL